MFNMISVRLLSCKSSFVGKGTCLALTLFLLCSCSGSDNIELLEMGLILQPAGPVASIATNIQITISTNIKPEEFPSVTVDGFDAEIKAMSHREGIDYRYLYDYVVTGNEREGEVVIEATAFDSQGNTASTTQTVVLDFSPPRILNLAAEPGKPATNIENITFSFECSYGGCSYECALEGVRGGMLADWEKCVSGISFDGLADDQYTFRVVALDLMYNRGEPAEWLWEVDTLVPTVTLVSHPDSPSADDFASFEFECSKDNCTYVCKLESEEHGLVSDSSACETGVRYENLEVADYKFSVVATDQAGNRSAPASWEWIAGAPIPNLVMSSGPNGPTNSTDATFVFACPDEECEYYCSLSGRYSGELQASVSCESPMTYEELEDDEYTFSVIGTNEQGYDSRTMYWEWVVDTKPPILHFVSEPDRYTNAATVMFEMECDKGNCTYSCKLDSLTDSSEYQSCDSMVEFEDLEDSYYIFYAIATDALGNNSAAQSLTFEIDTIEPVLEFTDELPGDVLEESVSHFSFECTNKACSTYLCSAYSLVEEAWVLLDSGDCSSPYDWDNLEPGRARIVVRATDRFGNTSKLEHEWTIVPRAWGNVDIGGFLEYHMGTPIPYFFGVTCGVADNGSLWCWGWNEYGRLGSGIDSDLLPEHSQFCIGLELLEREDTACLSPVQVGSHRDWHQVAIGETHACAIKQDGTLWCWGRNNYSQLGLFAPAGDFFWKRPTQVGSDSDWEQVSTNGYHTCAIKADGSLYCWGRNNYGQAGTGSPRNTEPQPERVGNGQWLSVSAGVSHSCGLKSGGDLYCWGHNRDGQLGLGTTNDSREPARVGAVSGWLRVSAGKRDTCAINNRSYLYCWGHVFEVTSPKHVASAFQPWEDVASGDLAWALNSTNTLYGVFAEGTNEAPTQLDWDKLSLSHSVGCALLQDKSLYCVGSNHTGSLGIGSVATADDFTMVGEHLK